MYPSQLGFKTKWNKNPQKDLKLVTGIRTQKQIEIIDYAVNSGAIKSMSNLIEYLDIGIATMQRCYQIVLSSSYTIDTIFD